MSIFWKRLSTSNPVPDCWISRAVTGGTRSNWRARGYRVTGIDLSDEFLAAARAELDADWRKGDMRALELEASAFDGAFLFRQQLRVSGSRRRGSVPIRAGWSAETWSEAGDRNWRDARNPFCRRWFKNAGIGLAISWFLARIATIRGKAACTSITPSFATARRNAARRRAMSSPPPNSAGCWTRRSSRRSRFTEA